ncbi:hypothetical protein [Antarcticimicrobium luteum]|uniref:Sulfotransferase family protein n=1 Tax=Antarcticimicrobium luteum TaxID=2547397 RepID=A0A4R5VES5_9RHOB|nr:hypothetical protein [Antarcticimicrobium luteum]TDK50897.1 hypothetical protein E1832_04970 [Antarcticimicrobium luteum]
MKRLFLHIGFNKTGSTSLQKTLARNAGALAEQGILYPYDPQAPYMQRWQHAPLAAAVPGRTLSWLVPKKRATLTEAFPTLRGRLEHGAFETLLLSSEGFGETAMGQEKIRWLKRQFPGFDISVIAYIRRQDAYFLSAYQEGIKAGRTRPFDFADHADAKDLYFGRRLAPWRAVFGSEKVIVRPFDPQVWPEGELFFDFLRTIGADTAAMTPEPPENEGLDYRAVEFMRQLNLLESGTQAAALPRVKARKLAATFSHLLAAADTRRKMQLSSEQAEILRTHFHDDNATALAGSGIAVEAFFPPVPQGRPARLAPPSLDPQDLLRLIAQLSPPSHRS